MHEQPPRLDVEGVHRTVHRERDLCHSPTSPPSSQVASVSAVVRVHPAAERRQRGYRVFSMVLPARVTVSVPGSSANLGPGFDCLGVALPLRLTRDASRGAPGRSRCGSRGEGADELPADASNLVVAHHPGGRRRRRARRRDRQRAAAGGRLRLVGGGDRGRPRRLRRARRPADRPRATDRARAVAIEGHPDNIAAAVYGGFTIAAGDPPMVRRIEPPARARPSCSPCRRSGSPRSAARAALAEQALRADAVHNVQRVALLVSSLYTGSVDDLLGGAVRPAAPGRPRASGADVRAPAGLADRIGALGVTLSGAGPSVLRLVPRRRRRALRRVRRPRGARRRRARDGARAGRARGRYGV